MTAVESAVWTIWNRLLGDEPSPVKRIAAELGMTPADVAFVVYPAETFVPSAKRPRPVQYRTSSPREA